MLTLTERIEGSARIRIVREFVTNAAIFPIFDAIRSIAIDGLSAYLTKPPHYLMFISAVIQAWHLGRKREYTWWEQFLGNLIGVAAYTLFDTILEGAAVFVEEPYHWVFWVFALGMAGFALLTHIFPRRGNAIIVLTSLWRGLLFPALYVLAEFTDELDSSLTTTNLLNYWNSSHGHWFILMAALLFGLLLGLGEAERNRYLASLQVVAQRLKQVSEWSLDEALLAESIDNPAALAQRRIVRTILFVDIRGFTHWSETKNPETVVAMLNQFYEKAEAIILTQSGQKPHFIGDEVMTWFANPVQALAAGRQLKKTAAHILKPFGLAVGGGIHQGEVIEGLLGTAKTRHYDLIGDAVNTASRITSAAEPGEMLVSEKLLPWLDGSQPGQQPRQVLAKGKQAPINVYPI